jgi:hypothetical protein
LPVAGAVAEGDGAEVLRGSGARERLEDDGAACTRRWPARRHDQPLIGGGRGLGDEGEVGAAGLRERQRWGRADHQLENARGVDGAAGVAVDGDGARRASAVALSALSVPMVSADPAPFFLQRMTRIQRNRIRLNP